MSSAVVDPTALHGFRLPLSQGCRQYEPSIASSAPSSQDSVFSETSSTHSSAASSISDDFRLSHEEAQDRCSHAYIQQQARAGHAIAQEQARLQCVPQASYAPVAVPPPLPLPLPLPSYADVTSVSAEQRQHPRRSSLARNQKPPSLVRQCERKDNFVHNLVDSATQMVEVIWPCSVVPCRNETGGGRGVLPLRTYIEETLRRSRTSYSTLQVALYYLILIKPCVPRADFTMEQRSDCPASRALMCGRRMFLSALILASKYLQDRNYSPKAWSKMSGLKVCEINTNERTFLKEVSWKLHIPEAIFKRWTDIVLKYTPNAHPPAPGPGVALSWKSIVPLLTPELDQVPLPPSRQLTPLTPCPASASFASPTTPTPTPTSTTTSAFAPTRLDSASHESTPTPLTMLPRFLEPKPDLQPPTPALARMGPLPTPQMTPSTVASNTPAASVCGSRRPSMCSAMGLAQRAGFARCAMDLYPDAPASPRRLSISALSSASSPESMISDRSRSSRASSISSVSTVSTASSLAPTARACLARQATCRNVRLPIPTAVKEEEGGAAATHQRVVADDTEMGCSSPELADFTVSDKVLHAPHRHSKHAPHYAAVPAPAADKSRKRARPRGSRRSDLQEEVRMLLEEELEALEMDIDDDGDSSSDSVAAPTPAVDYATRMLSRSSSVVTTKETQPSSGALSRRGSGRVPVQKNEGKKRTCCSASAMSMSLSPAALYGEVA